MKLFSLMLSEPLLDIIRMLSNKMDTPMAELIRNAMRDFIEKCVAQNLISREEADSVYANNTVAETVYPTFSE